MFRKLIICIGCAVILGACTSGLNSEQQAKVQALRVELEATKKEVAAAEMKDAQYNGGAVKAFTTLRIEILKINEALLQQRIQSIESGANTTIQVGATTPDPERAESLEAEIAEQKQKVSEALSKANEASGGLVGAMAQMGAATEANTLALLRQQYLIAKYGLASLMLNPIAFEPPSYEAQTSISQTPPEETNSDVQLKLQIVSPTLLRKRYAKQDYQDYIWFDIKFDAVGLDKPARAIKGALILTDLFDEQKFAIRWTIEKPIAPGGSLTEKGTGFEYNQFNDSHKWVRATDSKNIKIKFRVENILYEDGTTLEL